MSIILPNENERRSRLDDILYALCTLSLLDEYDVPNEDRINEYYKALLTGDLSELTFMPKSRIEKLLHFLTTGANEGIEAPKSRVEYLLYVLAGLMQVSALPFNVDERSSRHERYLMYLIENGGVGVKSLTVSFFNNQEILNSKEGSVENLTFKGNTILPVIKGNVLSEEADTANVECFDNEYEGEFKSAILKGNTLVNLIKFKSCSSFVSYNNGTAIFTNPTGPGNVSFSAMFKSSTKYIFKANFKCDGDWNTTIRMDLFPDTFEEFKGVTPTPTPTNYYFTFTTPSDISTLESFRIYVPTSGNGIATISNIMILEYQDGMENWDIPYFEGMTSVKMPVLTTTGKNMFDGKLTSGAINGSNGAISNSGTRCYTSEPILLQANLPYTFTISSTQENANIKFRQLMTYKDKKLTSFAGTYGDKFNRLTYTSREDVYVVLTVFDDAVPEQKVDIDKVFIQIEQDSTATSYEPFKSNILTTSEEVELRGIGEVKDELNLLTGELISNTAILNINGTEKWRTSELKGEYTKFALTLPYRVLGTYSVSNFLCDKIKIGTVNTESSQEQVSIYNHSDGSELRITISSSKVGLNDFDGLKEYLRNNNFTIIYPLSESTIKTVDKTVDLNIVDHNDNTLEKMSTFKDGHIILSSEEGALIPSLTYSVARNDAFELTNLKSNNTYTVQTNEKEFTLNGVTYPEIETSATTTASVDRVISIDDIYTRVDNVEKMVLEGMNYGNLLQESGQDEFVSHASDEDQAITINDTVEGRLKDLTLKGDTLVNILPSEPTLRNEMANSYSQKLNNDYDEVIVVDGEYKDLNVEGRTLLNLASVQNDSETSFYVVGEELNGQSIEIEQENFDYSVPRNLKDVTLEGSTYISKTASLINSMDNVSMQKLNEGYDEVNVVDGEFKSAILKGQTLVNIAQITSHKFDVNRTPIQALSKSLETGKQYTIIMNIVSQTVELGVTIRFAKDRGSYKSVTTFNGVGLHKSLFTATNDFNQFAPYTNLEEWNAGFSLECNQLMIIEGDYTSVDISFFEGMQSVKMPVLSTIGKNLFDGEVEIGTVNSDTGEPVDFPSRARTVNFLNIKPNISYSLKIFNEYYFNRVFFYDSQKNYISNTVIDTDKKIVTSPENARYIKLAFRKQIDSIMQNDDLINISNNSQIEEGLTATSYEPHKSNTLTCNEEVELRAVGNVKDELNLLTSELTQKIGELTINAYNTNISLHEFYDNTVALKISTDMVSTGEKQIICDSLPTITLEDMSNGSIGVATSTTDGDSYIYVSIPTDGLTTATIQDICAYFTTNPINIKYPLATKVVSEVELSVTDQDGVTLESPLAYNSGNITLSSDSILPSLDYEVQSLNSFSNLKPNTVYTIKKNTQDFSSTYKIAEANYRTSNTLTTRENNEVVVLTSTISVADEVALIEGNNIGIDIPYFEGMQSVEQPVLKTTGKNLCTNINNKNTDIIETTGAEYPNKLTVSSDYIKVKKGKTYVASNKELGESNVRLRCYDINKTYIGSTITSDTEYIRLRQICSQETDANTVFFQLEEGSTATPYEPYKSNTLTCNEEVTLRGIGDVKDELNLLTGELTQRIGEVVLDGSGSWWQSGYTTETKLSVGIDSPLFSPKSPIICNDLPNITSIVLSDYGIMQDEEKILRINVPKTIAQNVEEFKQWLNSKNLIIYGKLEQPTIKTVDLSIVNQDNAPQFNLQLQTRLSHITTSSDTLIPIFNISATNNYDVQIKPSTQYTVRLSQDVVGDQLSVDLGGTIQTVTSNEFTITTPSTLAHEQLRIGGEGNVIGEIQLFEGNATGLVNEYFDGMKVSKISILTTTGKNLFDVEVLNDRSKHVLVNNGTVVIDNCYSNQLGNWREIFGFLKPNSTYFYSCDLTYDGGSEIIEITGGFFLCKTVDDSTTYFRIPRNKAFTTPSDLALYDRVIIYGASSNDGVVTLKNIQFTESSVVTEYEPYKSNVLSTGEEIVLRSLPNGVCDTLNLVTGEYVQRLGEVVLDGSDDEYWELYNQSIGGSKYFRIGIPAMKSQENLYILCTYAICDKLKIVDYYYGIYTVSSRPDSVVSFGHSVTLNAQAMFVYQTGNQGDLAQFKQWLQSNPITVQYELATPIITQINPTITDQDENVINAPLAYKNGHIQVTTSEIAPIVNYEIPTSNSYHLDLAVNGGAYTVKGDNTNELITHNSEPLISDDTHLMVIEGDCVSKDVPYFEGMTSVQTPKLIISNCPFAFGKGGRI